MVDELGQKVRAFADEMRERHFGDKPRAPEKPLTEAEMHAKYAGANRMLREIYGTASEGTEHAD